MSGMRVYDLAKELHLSNTDIIDMLKKLGQEDKAPSSMIKEEIAQTLRQQFFANESDKAVTISGSSRPVSMPTASINVIDVPDAVALKDFALMIGVPASDIQKKLMGLGVLASLKQNLSPEVTTRIAKSYKVTINIVPAALEDPHVISPALPGLLTTTAPSILKSTKSELAQATLSKIEELRQGDFQGIRNQVSLRDVCIHCASKDAVESRKSSTRRGVRYKCRKCEVEWYVDCCRNLGCREVVDNRDPGNPSCTEEDCNGCRCARCGSCKESCPARKKS